MKIQLPDILGAASILSMYAACATADCGRPVLPVTLAVVAVAAGAGWYVESGQQARDRSRNEKE